MFNRICQSFSAIQKRSSLLFRPQYLQPGAYDFTPEFVFTWRAAKPLIWSFPGEFLLAFRVFTERFRFCRHILLEMCLHGSLVTALPKISPKVRIRTFTDLSTSHLCRLFHYSFIPMSSQIQKNCCPYSHSYDSHIQH